jgi:hypothetical protein
MMFADIEFNIKEYPIQGKMVVGQFTLSLNEALHLSDASAAALIKKEMSERMAQYIIENGLAEFTMQEDMLNMAKVFRMRCFLTPDEQVRLIRKIYDELGK